MAYVRISVQNMKWGCPENSIKGAYAPFFIYDIIIAYEKRRKIFSHYFWYFNNFIA